MRGGGLGKGWKKTCQIDTFTQYREQQICTVNMTLTHHLALIIFIKENIKLKILNSYIFYVNNLLNYHPRFFKKYGTNKTVS